jgi:hypothetical protein
MCSIFDVREIRLEKCVHVFHTLVSELDLRESLRIAGLCVCMDVTSVMMGYIRFWSWAVKAVYIVDVVAAFAGITS